MDLDDWKTDVALTLVGTAIGGPVGLASSLAFILAKHLSKKPGEFPRNVHLAASSFMHTNPPIGSAVTAVVDGKQYLFRAELHPLDTAGMNSGVAIYEK